MSETKWTPGPWVAVPNGPCFNFKEKGADAHHAILVGMNYNQPGEHEANAHLVAACPSLYAELERTVDALEALKKVYGATVHLEDARARGEQP